MNVARYRDIGLPPALPAEIAQAVRAYGPNIDAARAAANVPVEPAAIIEAARYVDAGVLDTWISHSGLPFATDASSLRQLADAGVPARVTDAMVATQANSRDVYEGFANTQWNDQSRYWDQDTGMRVIFWTNDPWSYGLGTWRYGREYTRYAFGTNDWGWVYGPGSLYGIGYRTNVVGYVAPPTIVLHDDASGTASRGKSEKADSASTTAAPPPAKEDGILAKAVKAMTGASSTPPKPPTKP